MKLALRSQKAFSLIEILTALTVIAFLMSFAARGFFKKDSKVKASFDRLIRLNRRLIDLSQSTGASYRLVFFLNDKGPDFYQAEKKSPAPSAKDTERESAADFKEGGEWRPARFFQKPQAFPSFLNLTELESPLLGEAVKSGPAYIYYHPRGFAQETRIRFARRDREADWTLYLDPAQKSLRVLKNAP